MSSFDDYISSSASEDYRTDNALVWCDRGAPARRHLPRFRYERPKRVILIHPAAARNAERAGPGDKLQKEFDRLAKAIDRQFGVTGFMRDIHSCDEYLAIIGFGPDVVPLLVRDLQRTGRPWFVALRAITREKVGEAIPAGNLRALAAAWIEWGAARGLV